MRLIHAKLRYLSHQVRRRKEGQRKVEYAELFLVSACIHFNPYVAGGYFGKYKKMQKKKLKNDWNLAYEYSYESTQQELCNEYQDDMV